MVLVDLISLAIQLQEGPAWPVQGGLGSKSSALSLNSEECPGEVAVDRGAPNSRLTGFSFHRSPHQWVSSQQCQPAWESRPASSPSGNLGPRGILLQLGVAVSIPCQPQATWTPSFPEGAEEGGFWGRGQAFAPGCPVGISPTLWFQGHI